MRVFHEGASHRLSMLLAYAAILSFTLPAFADTNVTGDDSRDEYTGRGAIIVTRGFSGEAKAPESAARCSGCRWRVTVLCPSDIKAAETGARVETVNPHPCVAPDASPCPTGTRRLKIYYSAQAGEELHYIGSSCFGARGPITRKHFDSAIAAEQHRHLPPLSLGIDRTVVVRGAKTILTIQPGGRQRFTMEILGHAVVVETVPTWTVRWGAEPPKQVRSSRFSHTWLSSGEHLMTLQVSWAAIFRVDSLKPLQVHPDLHQSAVARVRVLPAFTRVVAWQCPSAAGC